VQAGNLEQASKRAASRCQKDKKETGKAGRVCRRGTGTWKDWRDGIGQLATGSLEKLAGRGLLCAWCDAGLLCSAAG
jgi:hypothetical protein